MTSVALALSFALLAAGSSSCFAQDAKPEDRNATNSRAAPAGGMMADSPVTFPDKGALPAKHRPDVKVERLDVEKDYYLFGSPARTLGQADTIQSEMAAGEFSPPPNDWKHLERTRRALAGGGKLHVLGLGDSIVNDTFRSAWLAKLGEAYPKAKIKGTVYVRGGGGCHHYREEGRIAKYLVPTKPDLVFIGGISQQRDGAAIREVAREIKAALPKVEILLATGAFGTADPRADETLTTAAEYGATLKAIAEAEGCAYLDMTTPWAHYIRSSGKHPHQFYRDRVHANEHGEQILSKILLTFFTGASRSSER